MTILVTGGTGFVGGHVVHELRAQERPVRMLVREPSRGTRAAALGAELVRGDMTDPASLRRAVKGCSAVVHLVAIRRGRPEDFERLMVQGTRDLLAAARAAGVERFVHMSAAGTSEHTAQAIPYFRAKWESERAVAGSGIAYTIFRPSFVFGRDGGVLPLFLRQVRYLPLTPVVGSGLARLQPIWADDVAAYFAAAIDKAEARDRVFELGGPDVVTWNELYARIAKVLGKRRGRLNLPPSLVRTGAALTERLPGAPITRDELAMIESGDNVASDTAAVDTFALPLLPLDEQIRRAA
ncbi:MAG TPA: NAD-dependent epimerase/dehydratase family protein [Gaiellaceae bacterium]|nr:NAD-dependent epimerase/dehydratase family protein [Gaiellaceae bacterium]